MFEPGDEQYLLRAFNRNQALLFLGSGFSTLASNRLRQPLPTGFQLAEALWKFMGYPEPYDHGSPLSELYEALLASGKPISSITNFLEDHLLAVDVPREYKEITSVYWSRIYTTNIDNLLQKIYAETRTPRLDVFSYPNDELPDRDITLERIQAVHLHGRLPCAPTEITFSISQFARRATPHDHLYDHFVREYATRPTLFIGTSLNEPLLWQYIELRKAKRGDIAEERPKSFLIIKEITPPKRQLLQAMNVVPVLGTTSEFLTWLRSKREHIADRDDVLRVTIPGLVELVSGAKQGNERDLRAVRDFGKHFHAIPIEAVSLAKERSLFLLGASPKWEDLLADRDAPRSVTRKVQSAIEETLNNGSKQVALFAMLGSAGSGKSTTLRRVAIQLARAGHTCFLTNSEELARFDDITRALDHIGKRCILFFDNAETILQSLPPLLERLLLAANPPVCVVASRTNDYDRMLPRLAEQIAVQEFHMPNLSRSEIIGVLSILEREGLLGQLKGMSQDNRILEFESKAKKQLLVAMREATSGRGFDDIIEDEYRSLVPEETKLLYLCVALATEAGYRLTLQEFVGCAQVAPAEALSILSRNLRDIVLRTGIDDGLLMLRHRRIAEHMVNMAAPRSDLQAAYLRVLDVLSTEIGAQQKRSRTFSFFKAIIQHHTVFRRFGSDARDARMVYDSVMPKFSQNPQFLLQYGSLEMELGNLDVAENYLNQADSLDQDNPFIANAKGQLRFKQAIKASNKSAALVLRDEGSSILLANIENPELDDAYCYHIYCQLRLAWARVWTTGEEKKRELEELRTIATKGFKRFPLDKRISEVKLEIERDYYSLAT